MPDNTSSSGAASSFEAQIRASARPVLNAEQRAKKASVKASLEAQLAAARCREAAAAQLARAAEFDAQAKEFGG